MKFKNKSKKFFAIAITVSMMTVACDEIPEDAILEAINNSLESSNSVETDISNSEVSPQEIVSTNINSPIVTTGQVLLFDADGNVITPSVGEEFYGQDGNYTSDEFSFTRNDDGTTYDNNTGLTWETIPLGGKMVWEDAIEYCENLTLGGYDDWRIPSVEELFSISDFSKGWPYLDTEYFQFDESGDSINSIQGGSFQGGSPQGGTQERGGSPQGGTQERESSPQGEAQERELPPQGETQERESSQQGENVMSSPASKDDGQFWTASHNMVEGDERLGNIAFGVNHSTGHIKAYPANSSPIMGKYVRAVRGEVYGAENYTDNSDGTITDNESGLMWLQADLGVAVEWEEALYLAENSDFAGYDDWRLPNVKELQSIVDYSGSYPAINQNYFSCTELDENVNYYFWTSTSAYFNAMSPDYDSAWYVAFGYTSHGAGAVRFSPKYEESSAFSEGEDNILNSVRLVRNIG